MHPSQYAEALVKIVERGVDLRPFHVIVAESFEYNVEACLQDVPYRQGARIRRRSIIHEMSSLRVNAPEEMRSTVSEQDGELSAEVPLDEGGILASDDESRTEDENQHFIWVVNKTFICEAPRFRNPQSVTQSTTEVHGGGVNPRRVLTGASCGSLD